MGVASGCLDLENTVVNSQEGHVKSSSTKIIDNDLTLITGAVETIGDSCCGRFVDNSENVEAGNNSGIFCGLSLVVVEVGGDRDDGVGDLLAQVAFCDLLHFPKDHGGNFFGGERSVFAIYLYGNGGLFVLVCDTERKVLDIGLNILVGPFAPNETPVPLLVGYSESFIQMQCLLGVKDGSYGV